MSGTSLDGVDAAILETNGRDIAIPGPDLTAPYDKETRAMLKWALDAARELPPDVPEPQFIRDAERQLTELHAEAVKALLVKSGLKPADIALIGFHGQTILHRPDQQFTWQIGDGALLARETGIDVINDFRSADVKAGGQGAPLMPLYHAALARKSGRSLPLVLVNIGGVANVTYIADDAVLAFDTGPGNAPIDDWMQRHSGKPVDTGGAFAAMGKVEFGVLGKMLANPWFDKPPPKSLDRMDFSIEPVQFLPPTDGAATLTAFVAASIARAREHFPKEPGAWIITGGGRHNKTLMRVLKSRVKAPVLSAEEANWDGDSMEAEGLAYLAMRSKLGLPLSLPTTTGVPKPITGGVLHKH
jgi:anhydro-N-acetylmuramic acid kinase